MTVPEAKAIKTKAASPDTASKSKSATAKQAKGPSKSAGDGAATSGGPSIDSKTAKKSSKGKKASAAGAAKAADAASRSQGLATDDRLPIKMLNDRILVDINVSEGDRRSSGGILIPATAQVGKRLAWAAAVAVGPNVRSVENGDQVLFNPDDRYEVEVRGTDYIILRERDIHAVAAERLEEGSTGLYL